MRKVALILLLSVIFSCKKSENNNAGSGPNPTPSSNTWSFSAKVNGTLMHADSCYAELLIDTTESVRGLTVLGYVGPRAIFPMFADAVLTTNISNINGDMQHGAGMMYSDSLASFVDYPFLSSDFRITSVDYTSKKISGTFDAVVHQDNVVPYNDTVVISNGSFTNIPYTISWH